MQFEWIGTKWDHAAEECRNVVAMMLSTHPLLAPGLRSGIEHAPCYLGNILCVA